ncbi:MAG: polysaccharide biosynthesis/export family protein [Pseudomonadota bacterium]
MPASKKRLIRTASSLWLAICAVAVASSPATAQQPPDYRLHAGDQLEVSVWKEMDLLRTVIIRPDGKFTFPLVGEIVAAGNSVDQINTAIATRLKKYIPDPVVTVSVTGIEGNRVYVIGQVNKPGVYTMNPQLSVLQALSVAGGATPFAALNDIMILRGTAAAQKTLPFRYGDVSKGRNLEQNILLESGDVVVVP